MSKSTFAFRFDESRGYGVIRAGNKKNALKCIKDVMYEDYPEDEHAEYVDIWEETDIEESRYIECEECCYISFDIRQGDGCTECGKHENRKGYIGYKLSL